MKTEQTLKRRGPAVAVSVAEPVSAPAPRGAALPEEERLRLGLPMKLPLQPSRLSRSRGMGRGRGEGVLVVTPRRVMAAVGGQTASIMLEEPFQVHLSRWDQGLRDGDVELGVSLRQGEHAVELCVRLESDEVDADALPLRESAAPTLDRAHFAGVWGVLVYYARLHRVAVNASAVRPKPAERVRARVDVPQPRRCETYEDASGLHVQLRLVGVQRALNGVITALTVAPLIAILAAFVATMRTAPTLIVVVLGVFMFAPLALFVLALLPAWIVDPFTGRVGVDRARLYVREDRSMWSQLRHVGKRKAQSDPRESIARDAVDQLYVADMGSGYEGCALCVLAHDGSHRVLVERMTRGEAMFLELEFERWLGISDREVDGERLPEAGAAGGPVLPGGARLGPKARAS